jgi:hypothetical protein
MSAYPQTHTVTLDGIPAKNITCMHAHCNHMCVANSTYQEVCVCVILPCEGSEVCVCVFSYHTL